MPATLTYPGVYVEEIPSGVHTITGVATSITAFIGRAVRGQIDEATTINSFAEYERNFGGLSLISPMSFAVRGFYLNGGSQAVIVRVINGGATARATLPTAVASPPSSNPPGNNLFLDASSPGSWGNNLSVLVDHNTKDKGLSNADPTLFNITVSEIDPTTNQVVASEKFLNVSSSASNPRFVAKVLEQGSSLLRVPKDAGGAFLMPNARPRETVVQASPPVSPPVPATSSPVKATGGSDGSDVTQAQFIGAGMEDPKKGLYALAKADLFNLLCIPPFSSTTDVTVALVGEAAAYCEKRRAMLIVDPPSSWTTKKTAKDQFSDPNTDFVGTRSNYAALFFPRIKQSNPLRDNQVEEFVPCGAVSGVFARTDAQRGVWKAPAGQEASLVGVPQLSVSLTDDENGELNPLGVNCLRAFPLIGRVVWGSRTLEGADQLASEWKYVPVRRTALYIEESLYRGTKWVVFEPNDEPLWDQIRLNVGAFMQNLFRQGAFQGKTPREAYFVKCDKETTTQNDINLGIVNILVGFAPLKPAEFVILKIQQMAGQIET
ncbi:MAG: phage tail sheath subtilisin-like domain-containing protein [Acidobacteriota bacterium]|nr:phage tail sheath subtilisin-like domain-containing protein [Acidobacteriota bacterium]